MTAYANEFDVKDDPVGDTKIRAKFYRAAKQYYNFEIIKRYYELCGHPLNMLQRWKMNRILSPDQREYLALLANSLVNSTEHPDPADYYPIFAMHGGGSVIHDNFHDVMYFFYGESDHRYFRKCTQIARTDISIQSKIHRCVQKKFYFDAIKGLFEFRGTQLNDAQIKILNDRSVLSYDQLEYLAHLADSMANSTESPDPAQYYHIFKRWNLELDGYYARQRDFDDALAFFLSISILPFNFVRAYKIKLHFSDMFKRKSIPSGIKLS